MRDIEFLKDLFNFHGDETQLQYIKELFTNYLRNSKNAAKHIISLLGYFSRCRPPQPRASKELVEYVYSCFPEQKNEIQQTIKKTEILKFIVFPEEFPIEGTK